VCLLIILLDLVMWHILYILLTKYKHLIFLYNWFFSCYVTSHHTHTHTHTHTLTPVTCFIWFSIVAQVRGSYRQDQGSHNSIHGATSMLCAGRSRVQFVAGLRGFSRFPKCPDQFWGGHAMTQNVGCQSVTTLGGFEPRTVYVGFSLDNIALGQVFPQVHLLSPH
jgi:hypothetical protein